MKKGKIHIKFVLFLGICLSALNSYSQDLKTYIDEAIANSPEIQKVQFQYGIAAEKVNEANWLPNTEVSAGYFVSEPETRVGAQRARFSLKQMIPWFGTITARENYMNSMAAAQYEELVIAKRKLVLSVSQSYYNLMANKAKQEVLEKNVQLLETYERLALTSLEVGKASAVSVLRLQIRQNELEQSKEVLQQQFLAEQAVFNNLLNRESDMTVVVVSEPKMPLGTEMISEENLKVHPELTKYDKLYESVSKSELLNKKESSPMIGFGLDYIPVSERTDMNPIDNGKDILMPMVTLSIPIFNNKYKSQTKQNQLKQQEITSQKEERLNALQTMLSKAIYDRNSARISYDTQSKNLKQAKDAEEILIKNYETGTIDFNDVLDIQELQLKFQINQIESVKTYYVQSTIINYLTN
ncbi:TolC family protein [Aequorivita vladivostokensis]|uniref:Transporter n=1 Tax=Aequorivita vladivostokensis TaxID=171194 RepID=A0ABR5DKS9_9FLAO|nr:TolC family protein [Aequorivita vladivostokensis]KJJ39380.1 transporter [Aequorivita vladivostokensis]